jgi:hypothetical protein
VAGGGVGGSFDDDDDGGGVGGVGGGVSQRTRGRNWLPPLRFRGNGASGSGGGGSSGGDGGGGSGRVGLRRARVRYRCVIGAYDPASQTLSLFDPVRCEFSFTFPCVLVRLCAFFVSICVRERPRVGDIVIIQSGALRVPFFVTFPFFLCRFIHFHFSRTQSHCPSHGTR